MHMTEYLKDLCWCKPPSPVKYTIVHTRNVIARGLSLSNRNLAIIMIFDNLLSPHDYVLTPVFSFLPVPSLFLSHPFSSSLPNTPCPPIPQIPQVPCRRRSGSCHTSRLIQRHWSEPENNASRRSRCTPSSERSSSTWSTFGWSSSSAMATLTLRLIACRRTSSTSLWSAPTQCIPSTRQVAWLLFLQNGINYEVINAPRFI